MIVLLLLVMVAAVTPCAAGIPDPNMEHSPRMVSITVELTLEKSPAGARVWFPMPRQGKWQTLERFDVAGQWPYRIVSDSTYGNRFLVIDVPGERAAEKKIKISFLVTRRPVPKGEGETDDVLPAAKTQLAYKTQGESNPLALYLLPRRLIPLSGSIAAEAQAVAGDLLIPMKIARRLFDHVVGSMRYDKSGVGWGKGDALYACSAKAGNCTDFHSLFIAEARALGLPARFVMGLPLPEDYSEGKIPGYHCWGEFFVEGRGWLPLDASEASKHIERKDSYFAALDANRVAFTLGRDITVPDANHEPFNYLIYPYVEVEGLPYEATKIRFTFRDLPR